MTKMNAHSVWCDVHQGRGHRMCGVCIPIMEKAGILSFNAHKMKFSATSSQQGLCPSKELLTSMRLMTP